MCFSTWRLVGISRWVDFEARQGGVRELEMLREEEKKERVSDDADGWTGPQRVEEVQVLSGASVVGGME